MHLNRKGPTNKLPPFMLVGLILLFVGKVVLFAFGQGDVANCKTLVHWQSPAMTLPDSDKPTLYYFSGHDSEPCELTARAFQIPAVAELANSRFAPVALLSLDKLQMTSPELPVVRRFKIHSVPALVVVAPDGKEIDRMVGGKSAVVIYEFLQNALRGRPSPLEDD